MHLARKRGRALGVLGLLAAGPACVNLGFVAGKLALSLGPAEIDRLLAASGGSQPVSVPFQGAQVSCGLGGCRFPLRQFVAGSKASEAVAPEIVGSFVLSTDDLGGLIAMVERSKTRQSPIQHEAPEGALECTARGCRIESSLRRAEGGGAWLPLSTLIASAMRSSGPSIAR